MKKILFIGDLHGQDDWKELAYDALTKFYDIVFLGDYVDSFTIKPVEILHNLKEIIEFKKKYPKRVTLLLGNHDFAYINQYWQTSGYNHSMANDYRELFLKNHKLFQVAWGYRNSNNKYTLATHAGLTLTYYNNYIKVMLDDKDSKINQVTDGKASELELHEILNLMRNETILWKVGSVRGGIGTPGPLWADYTEFLYDRYKGINQIFGHTAVGTISIGQLEDDLIAKVDGNYNKILNTILISL